MTYFIRFATIHAIPLLIILNHGNCFQINSTLFHKVYINSPMFENSKIIKNLIDNLTPRSERSERSGVRLYTDDFKKIPSVRPSVC